MSDIDRIRQMVEEGRITQEEAEQLIAVLREVDAAGERLAAAGAAGEAQTLRGEPGEDPELGDAEFDAAFDEAFDAEYHGQASGEAGSGPSGAVGGQATPAPTAGQEPATERGPTASQEPATEHGPTASEEPVTAHDRTNAHEPTAAQEPTAAREPGTAQEPTSAPGPVASQPPEQPAPPPRPAQPRPPEPAPGPGVDAGHRAEPHAALQAEQQAREQAREHAREIARQAREAAREAQHAAREAARQAARQARDAAKEAMRAARDSAKEVAREAKHAAKEAERASRDVARGVGTGFEPVGAKVDESERPGADIAPAGTRWVTVEMLGGDLDVFAVPGLTRPTVAGGPGEMRVDEVENGYRIEFAPDRSGFLGGLISSIRSGDIKLEIPPDHGLAVEATAGDVSLKGVRYLRGRMRAGDLSADRLEGVDFGMTAGEFEATLDLRSGRHVVTVGAGNVDIALPADADVTVNGRVSIGDADTNVPGLQKHGSGLGGAVSGTLGTGSASLELRVTTGDLEVRRARGS